MWISSFFSIFHYICFDYIYWNAILCLSSLIIKKFRLLFSVTIFSFHISNNSFVLNFTKVSWPVAHWRLKTKQNKANSQPLTTESLRNCLRLSRGRKLSLKDQMVNILGLQAMSGGLGGSYERTFTLGLVYFYTVRIFTSNFSCIIDTD